MALEGAGGGLGCLEIDEHHALFNLLIDFLAEVGCYLDLPVPFGARVH